ncbi:hypothetical protein ACVW00_000732 [Marmoricola sp. URHA0025 HA25]
MAGSVGRRFAQAIADKDSEALTSMLSPEVDFRALTPRKFWEAGDPGEVLEIVFGSWFEDSDHIDELVDVSEGDDVEDTHHVSYRFAITNPDGTHTVEQQAYYRTDDDRIDYVRIVCSGFRPAE